MDLLRVDAGVQILFYVAASVFFASSFVIGCGGGNVLNESDAIGRIGKLVRTTQLTKVCGKKLYCAHIGTIFKNPFIVTREEGKCRIILI